MEESPSTSKLQTPKIRGKKQKDHGSSVEEGSKTNRKKSEKHSKQKLDKCRPKSKSKARNPPGSLQEKATSLLTQSRRGVKDSTPLITREQKVEEIKELVHNMTEDDRKNMLHQLAERMPGVILSIIHHQQASEPPPPTHPPAAILDPSWCICTYCRQMPTEIECLCCRQVPQRCISTLAIMRHLVLDHHVLELARLHRNDMLGQNDQPQAENDVYNRRLRHSAYRQYVLCSMEG